MNRTAWLTARQHAIGSSDAPNLVGVGFRTAADVYREKTSTVVGGVPTRGVLARGIALEPVVAAMYADAMGVEIRPVPVLADDALIRSRVRPWQVCTPDRIRVDGRIVELKTVAGFGSEWGESGSADVPDGYAVQTQHQMGVAEADALDLAALDVIAWELRIYRLAFDRDFFAWLTDIEYQFLRDHVTTLTPPGPEWERRFKAEAESRIVRPGTRVVLPPQVAALCERRAELKSIAGDALNAAHDIDDQLDALVADHEQATVGAWKLKRVTRKGHHRPACDVAESTYLDVRKGKA